MSTPEDYQVIEPLNPVEVETAIDQLRRDIARGVPVVSQAEKHARQTKRAYERAYAKAYLNASGAQPERKEKAVSDPDVVAALDAYDVADLALRHAGRVAESLQDQLRALQSINRSVTSVYGAETGFGR